MNKFNDKSGFTLIEIIVVMIIVGILAAIALPNLFSNIARSKAAQALQSLDSYKTPLEGYAYQNPNATPSTATITALGLATQLTSQGLTWTFSVPAAGNTATANATAGAETTPAGNITAADLTYSIAANDGNTAVVLTRSAAGTWSCSSPTAGPYAGVC